MNNESIAVTLQRVADDLLSLRQYYSQWHDDAIKDMASTNLGRLDAVIASLPDQDGAPSGRSSLEDG